MKVLHIFSGRYNSGASLGALNLCKGLLNENIDLSILNDQTSIKIKKKKIEIKENFLKKIKSYIYNVFDRINFYNYKKKIKFSSGFKLHTNILNENKLKNVDLIHLHWINNGFVNLNELYKTEKPIIWTLRDMWPFTGGCHYSLNCEKYKKKCFKCNNLDQIYGSESKDFIKEYFFLKKKIFEKKNIYFVAISKWLKDSALKSKLLKNQKIYQIYNCIDNNIFYREEMLKARVELKLPIKKKIILFGSQKLYDPIKNNQLIESIIQSLDKSKYLIICFGEKNINKFGIKNFGFVNQNLLRKLYSSSDIYLSFSKQEAFGKTLVESLMCGTPVVCNNNNSSKEIVVHKKNGYIISENNYIDGINWVLNNLDKRNNLNFFEYTKKFYIEKISKEYIRLYDKILNERKVR